MLPELRKTAPAGIEITPVYDQGDLVRTSIDNVRDAILVGGAFSVLVLLLFLRSIRATLLTAISIPLSLVITFVFLHLTGDTLNLMSLGGLAVAIGLIIDDSVVVVENIARHLAEGQSGDEAINRASREISGAVIGSTFTTILVFLPLAFVRGVVGQFFQSLSLSLTVALLVSMVVSLTVVPVLASRFLANRPMPSSGPIYRLMADVYEGVLRRALRRPLLMMVLAVLAVVPGWWFWTRLDSGFMPEMDEGAFMLDYLMPPGTSLNQTDKVARRIDKILLETPDVAGYLRRAGAENGIYATEAFKGDIVVALKPAGQRRPYEEIKKELEEKLKDEVPEADTELTPLIRDQINDLNGIMKPVEVKIFGPDLAVLRDLAEKVGNVLKEKVLKKEDIESVSTHAGLGNPDIIVRPDRAALARAGLTEQDLENQLNAALYGQVAATLPEKERITDIRIRAPDKIRLDPDRVEQIPIAVPPAANRPAGETAPLGFVLLRQLAAVTRERSPNELWRENQQPMIDVTADVEAKDVGRVAQLLQKELPTIALPHGYRMELAGEFKAQQEAFANLAMVMLSAAALVYVLLGFQFRSLALPMLIFLSQPISLASALGALWITGTPLNVSSFMGAILLIGLDVKNGIILIEYIGQLRAEGHPLHEALLHAGRVRFRPILMTSLATILGLLPLAFGFGPGADAAAAGHRRDRRPDGEHARHAALDSGGIFASARKVGPACRARLPRSECEHVRRHAEVFRQLADVSPVQGAFALQDFRDRRNRDSRGVGDFGLGNAFGLDKVAEHFRVRDRRHGVRLGLISLDQVAQNVEVILFLRGKVPPVQERVNHADCFVEVLVGTKGTKRELENQFEVTIVLAHMHPCGPALNQPVYSSIFANCENVKAELRRRKENDRHANRLPLSPAFAVKQTPYCNATGIRFEPVPRPLYTLCIYERRSHDCAHSKVGKQLGTADTQDFGRGCQRGRGHQRRIEGRKRSPRHCASAQEKMPYRGPGRKNHA